MTDVKKQRFSSHPSSQWDCALSGSQVPISVEGDSMAGPDRFVRVPTDVLEAVLKEHLSGGQYRVLFWVIRQTYGWNRPYAPFSWYRMAQELGITRPALYRAGQALVASGILVLHEGQVGVRVRTGEGRQLLIPGLDVAKKQRSALPDGNASVAGEQLKRCQQATVFRRAKDSSKDRLKTYKDRHLRKSDAAHHRSGTTDNTERRHLAGAARPIPEKYDGLSQN
jgi:phage replication O-like protein O